MNIKNRLTRLEQSVGHNQSRHCACAITSETTWADESCAAFAERMNGNCRQCGLPGLLPETLARIERVYATEC